MQGLLIIVAVMFVGLSVLVVPTIIRDRKERHKHTSYHPVEHR